MRRSVLRWVFAVVALTSCQSGVNDAGPSSVAPATTTAPTSPASTGTTDCANVATRGQALSTAVSGFINGSATADQVRTAADDLSTALTAARVNAQANAAAALDDARTALDRLVSAVQARPVDVAGLRTASSEVLTALGNAAAVCQPAPTS